MGFNKLGSTVISYTEFTETLFGNEFQTKTDFNSTTRYLKLKMLKFFLDTMNEQSTVLLLLI